MSYIPYATNAQVEVPYSTELPAPKVLYEYVSMESLDTNDQLIGRIDYKFNVMKRKDPDKLKYGDFYEINVVGSDTGAVTLNNTPNSIFKTTEKRTLSISKYSIHDNLNAIGQLLSVATYNTQNQKLSELQNTYYTPEDLPDNMGVTIESFQSYKKKVKAELTGTLFSTLEAILYNNWFVNSSERIKYPSILKSSTEIKNGITYTTTFSDFDLTSGQAKETHTYSSKGLELKTISEPAFYKYPEMGSKVDSEDNKNMLSQGEQTLTYIKNRTDTEWKLIGSDVQTWNDYPYTTTGITGTGRVYRGTKLIKFLPSFGDIEKNVWRKHKNYAWKGELDQYGAYKDFVAFNWAPNTTQNEGWQKISEITKYSDWSRPLETIDINGNKASTKLMNENSQVMVVCNSGYNEMYYSGAESRLEGRSAFVFDGEVKAFGVSNDGSNSIGTNEVKAHTGKQSLRVGNTQNSYEVTLESGKHRAGTYKVSVWVDKGKENVARVFINGTSKPFNGEKVVAGNWVLLNHYEALAAGEEIVGIRTSASGQIMYADDFRLHPIESSMTTYVYNEWDELTYILGANNMATHYEYDDAGRLKKTFIETIDSEGSTGGFKMINQLDYHYKNQ